MEDFDFVIVGSGAAGCVLANRLSESGDHRVLLLEAGGEPRSPWISIPAGFSKLLVNEKYNWRFKTAPEPNTKNRVIAVPRGKGLGGSTLINGMIYVRGQAQDYDAWRDGGAPGWGFDDVAPYFKKAERYDRGGDDRGKDGPFHLEQVGERFPISDAFLAAAEQAGEPLNDDYNSERQEGFGYYQVNQRGGRRWSAYDAYLKPVRHRTNLRIETNAHVTRLQLDASRRCTGVTFWRDGLSVSVRARREVIVSAGAIQTPQLLELSGIGQPERLASLGIEVVHALHGVGENYLDHFATRMNWRVRNTATLNEMSRGWRLMREVGKYVAGRKGILTLGTGLVHGFVKTRPELATPDAQYFFVHASYANAAERVLDRQPGMTLGVTQLRPRSIGSIHIQSRDPRVDPTIRPNFLSSPEDQDCIVRGMKIGREIMRQPAIARFIDVEISPGSAVQSDEQWLEFARENGQTIYHPIGTCKMGTDDLSVVDSDLKLKGLSGVRVVDASVMPRMVSGNIQAAVIMLAERAADIIRGKVLTTVANV